MNWIRTNNLNQKSNQELWIRRDEESIDEYNVYIDCGKRTDLLKLKTNIVSDIESNIEFYADSRNTFFSNSDNLQAVSQCPVCGSSSKETVFQVEIYNAPYYQCKACTHVYLLDIPKLSAIEDFYRNSTRYSQTYTSKQGAEFRLEAVDAILAQHMVNKFQDVYGTSPKRVLDIGAGGGHFVEACRRKGMEADGFEFSESSIKFSEDTWGIKLDNRDYVQAYKEYENYDAVTFWGLLEHVPNPLQFLQAAVSSLKNESPNMIMCRVPKWDSLSTAVQSLTPDSIVRHLDPLGHMMIYTESSICELFRRIGYKPATIWYYGMDTYELFMQLGHQSGSYSSLMNSSHLQQELQIFLDNAYLSDLMVLAFIPAN